MSLMNHERVRRMLSRGSRGPAVTPYRVHKQRAVSAADEGSSPAPRLSIILLDWACRDSLHALHWLNQQDVPRDAYELIWIDLYDRVPDAALEQADTVVTLHQRGLYHKHIGYNVGLLLARGELVTICDSDAVFPRDFVASIFSSFALCSADDGEPAGIEQRNKFRSQVLMHHELRTPLTYPDQLHAADELNDHRRWKWRELHPNVGACLTVRRADALRFGGFDEHASYRGYLCGPYDLGWRLVNAGLPEIWQDASVVLWHFAHPDPVGSSGVIPSLRTRLETLSAPHVDLHALRAVESFSLGRLLPLRENPEIHALRLAARRIGTDYEARYASLPMSTEFSSWQRLRLQLQIAATLVTATCLETIGRLGRRCLGSSNWVRLKRLAGATR